MIKNAIKAKDNSVYLLVKETKSGKTEQIKNIVKDEPCKLLSYKKARGKFTFENIKKIILKACEKNKKNKDIIIDGLVDHLDLKHSMDIINAVKNYNFKVIISSANSELINSAIKIGMAQGEETQNFDFKIIANERNLTWQQIYIHYYWSALMHNKGNVKFENESLKMNQADFAALIIASRYWGKVNAIFKTEKNTNKLFFKNLTLSFFHSHGASFDFSTLEQIIALPPSYKAEKLKSYLTIDGKKVKFNLENLEKIIADMNVLKEVNFDLFLKSIYGRQILEAKKDKISPEDYEKYSKIISPFAHSVDFIIIQLLTANGQELENTIETLKKIQD